MSKITNLLSILWLLDSGNTYTAKEIAEYLEVSERTVYRYMDSLSMSGYPIISKTGNEGGYSLLKKSDTLFTLTAEDQLSVLMAQEFFELLGVKDSNLEKIIEKMNRYNSDKVKVFLAYNNTIEVLDTPEAINMKVIYDLSQAIRDKNRLKIIYNSGHNKKTDRVIDPYKILFWNYKWYLIAYCYLRSDYRIFRVDKICKFENILQAFSPSLDFNPVSFFNEKMTPDIGKDVEMISVVIEGEDWAIQRLKEHWYLNNYMTETNKNWIKFELENSIISNYLPNILLPFSQSISIKEPTSFRKHFVLYLEEIIRNHRNN